MSKNEEEVGDKDKDDCFPRRAQVVRDEARCPEHGHLLGKFDSSGALVIKCRQSEFVRVEGRPA